MSRSLARSGSLRFVGDSVAIARRTQTYRPSRSTLTEEHADASWNHENGPQSTLNENAHPDASRNTENGDSTGGATQGFSVREPGSATPRQASDSGQPCEHSDGPATDRRRTLCKAIFGIGTSHSDTEEPSSRLIHPFSPFAIAWLVCTCFFLLYTAIVTPAGRVPLSRDDQLQLADERQTETDVHTDTQTGRQTQHPLAQFVLAAVITDQ